MRRLLAAILLLTASAVAQVSVTVTPGNAASPYRNHLYVLPGSIRTFYAAVTGNVNVSVTWSATGGTLSGQTATTTQWTAPATPGTYHVTGTSSADGTKTSTADIDVVSLPVQIDAVPLAQVLYKGQIQVLQSFVLGTVDTRVTWTKSGGTFMGNTTDRAIGFKADTAGTYTVTATSVADPSKTVTATMYVSNNAMPATASANGTMPIDCTPIRDIPGAPQQGTTYDVGAGKTYTNIGDVPWENLAAGDTVRVYPGTYHEQFGFTSTTHVGSSALPIRVCGVRDASGNLPEIDGSNATLRSGIDFWQFGGQGAALVGVQSHSVTYGEPQNPKYVTIEGFSIHNAGPAYNYLAQGSGTPTAYSSAPACINVRGGRHVTIRGNEAYNCENGFYAASSDTNGLSLAPAFVLWEGNYLHDQGTVSGNSNHHTAYLEELGEVFQFNVIGRMKATAAGSSLKSRSTYKFIRYNYIRCGARCLDIVEPQNSANWAQTDKFLTYKTIYPTESHTVNDVIPWEEATYKEYVYGNILYDIYEANYPHASNAFHYSTDTIYSNPIGGVLYFYNNTIHVKKNRTDPSSYGYDAGMVGKYDEATYEWSRAELYNNGWWREIRTDGSSLPFWTFNHQVPDRMTFGKNWVNATCVGSGCTTPGNGGDGTGFSLITNIYGYGNSPWPGSNPSPTYSAFIVGSENVTNGSSSTAPINTSNYTPAPTSPWANAGQVLPSAISDLPVGLQFQPVTMSISERLEPLTFGALDSGAGPVNPPDPPASNGVVISGGVVIGGGVVVQ